MIFSGEIELKNIHIDKNTIDISNEKIDQIEKYLFEQSAPVFADKKIEELSGLQKAAKMYIEILQKGLFELQQIFKIQNFNKQIYFDVLQAKKGSAVNFATMEEKYKASIWALSQYIETIALATEAFSEQCQTALGYETSILYIPDADKPVIYQTKKLEDLLSQGHLTKARISKNDIDMKNMAKNIKSGVQEINVQKTLGLQQANWLETTYSTVVQRYDNNRYTSHTGKGKISIIMWNMLATQPSNKWLAMIMSNKGDLAQTYANIVMTRNHIFTGTTSPEEDINAFMWKVTEVDSVSGLLEGDITYGRQSFSVKANQANTQGIALAMKLASEILNQTNDAAIKKLLKEKQHEFAYTKEENRKGIRNFVVSATDTSIRQYIKP